MTRVSGRVGGQGQAASHGQGELQGSTLSSLTLCVAHMAQAGAGRGGVRVPLAQLHGVLRDKALPAVPDAA